MFQFEAYYPNNHYLTSRRRKFKGKLSTAWSLSSAHSVTSYVTVKQYWCIIATVKEAHIKLLFCTIELLSSAVKTVSLLFNKTFAIKHKTLENFS